MEAPREKNTVETGYSSGESSDKSGYIETGLQQQSIKTCPFCGAYSELIGGCNYVTCWCKQGFNGKSEWCWLCGRPKYQPWNGAVACTDPAHNSH